VKHPIVLTALTLIFAGASSWAEGADDDWFDSVAGKKLVAVDDSTFTLSPSEDGIGLEIVSPTGVVRDLSLSFVADGVGTVSDGGTRPVGVFRETDTGLTADFTDGHSETFMANSQGGVSLMLNAPQASAWCMRWYPQGHVFDVTDRKAALAAYASKLGLSGAKEASLCSDPVSATPPTPKPRPEKVKANDAPDQSASTTPIMVRVSQVHPIDPPAAEDPPVAPAAAPVAQPALKIASVAPPPATPAQTAIVVKPGVVASACLSVDSNGSGWGFRNTCGYTVQFAYCLKNGTDKSAACGSGTGTGDVKPNGFALVLDNTQIVTAEEEFRWVACAGGSDQVAAHLDRPDPPAGRCVPVRAL
jgi:hypothetical protein